MTTLLKAIEDKFLPETPFLERPKGVVSIDQIEPGHATVWVNDRLFKVAYRESVDGFVIGDAVRVGKAQIKKDQAPDGSPPMTNPEERAESNQLIANAESKTQDLTGIDDPVPCPSCGKTGPHDCSNANAGVVQDTAKAEVARVRKMVADAKAILAKVGEGTAIEDAAKCEKCGMQMKECKCAAQKAGEGTAIEEDTKCAACGMKKADCKCASKAANKSAHSNNPEKIGVADPYLEEVTRQLDAVTKSLKELHSLEEVDMPANAEQLAKARRTVAGHLAELGKAIAAHKAGHDRMHKSHESLLEAHKAVHEAHKAAHDSRQVHKASHDAFHAKAAECMDGISKVLGGGPESASEFGEPDKVTEGLGGTGSQSTSYASEVHSGVPADKAIKADDIRKIVAEELTAVLKAMKGEDNPTDKPKEVTKAAVDEKKDEPVDIRLEIQKAVTSGLTEIFKALAAPPEAASGTGDRTKARPFTKAEDGGGMDNVNGMTDQDWEAYRRGDGNAIKKAQRCTSMKWQEVPSRILQRRQATN